MADSLGKGGTTRSARVVRPLAVCVGAAVLLHATGIGCPIKFLTGVSCPGCGLTRAWLAAFCLRFDLALAYHPLFWSVPLVAALLVCRERIPRTTIRIVATVAIAAFVVTWAVRLALPHEANVLFSGLLTKDVVCVGTPPWLELLREFVA